MSLVCIVNQFLKATNHCFLPPILSLAAKLRKADATQKDLDTALITRILYLPSPIPS